MRFKQVHRFNKKRRTPERRLPGTTVAVENGNVDKAIRKLKKKLQKEDFFNEIRKREFFETRNEKRRKEISFRHDITMNTIPHGRIHAV